VQLCDLALPELGQYQQTLSGLGIGRLEDISGLIAQIKLSRETKKEEQQPGYMQKKIKARRTVGCKKSAPPPLYAKAYLPISATCLHAAF
jgi:hypothetical protein